MVVKITSNGVRTDPLFSQLLANYSHESNSFQARMDLERYLLAGIDKLNGRRLGDFTLEKGNVVQTNVAASTVAVSDARSWERDISPGAAFMSGGRDVRGTFEVLG